MKKTTHSGTNDHPDLRDQRKEIRKALKIHRQNQDKKGEAQDWSLLGAMILVPTGDAHFNDIKSWVDGQASDLGYTKKRFDAMTQELQKVCRCDQIKSLIETAFRD